MAVFQLNPAFRPDGDFVCAWFDDDACTWDDRRLRSVDTLAATWEPPSLRLYRPERGATAVLFNPVALAVSDGVRQELAEFSGIEFLPVHIEGHGDFHVLHVTTAIELPDGSDARLAPAPSGNIVQLDAFPSSLVPPAAFFRILQPRGSAARKQGLVSSMALYLDDAGARAVEAFSAGCLVATPMPVTA